MKKWQRLPQRTRVQIDNAAPVKTMQPETDSTARESSRRSKTIEHEKKRRKMRVPSKEPPP